VSHANAALTPAARLKLGKLIVEKGWSVGSAAEFFRVSWPTAKRWSDRYRELAAGGSPITSGHLQDRSSRPVHSPGKTPPPVVRKIVHLRWKKRMGPVQIAGKLNMPASTVHAVLVRCHLNRLTHVDRVSGEVIRRYEHPYPGSLVHVDVKKLGNIPTAVAGGTSAAPRATAIAQPRPARPRTADISPTWATPTSTASWMTTAVLSTPRPTTTRPQPPLPPYYAER
jgi:hypothetical protein